MRLAVASTHPIQYYAPFFRQLDSREGITVHVFYNWTGAALKEGAFDPGFEEDVEWDLPLLEGYDSTFVPNISHDPGTHHFWGLVNPELVSSVRSWSPDAVLVYGWNYASHLWALLRLSGTVPIFFRGDSTLLDESSGARKWARRLWLRSVYRHVDAALYVGKNNRAYYEAHGLEDDQLFWVPHAVDNSRFAKERSAEQEALQWRRELGIHDDHPVVLFAGKLEAKKAPDTLVDAFTGLSGDAHLIMVGSGSMEDELRSRVGEHPRVHFLGFQNQSKMPVVYRLGDLFVLPSRGPGETWGLAVNEAMACGRPVVVSNKVGCAPDLVDNENGAIVQADDVSALRDTLCALLEDERRLDAMGRHSMKRIAEWSVKTAADRTVKSIRDVLNK